MSSRFPEPVVGSQMAALDRLVSQLRNLYRLKSLLGILIVEALEHDRGKNFCPNVEIAARGTSSL